MRLLNNLIIIFDIIIPLSCDTLNSRTSHVPYRVTNFAAFENELIMSPMLWSEIVMIIVYALHQEIYR